MTATSIHHATVINDVYNGATIVQSVNRRGLQLDHRLP
jgi:hypothetical protein